MPHTGSRDLILRVEQVGGFVAPQALLQRYPSFSLYGDGTVITVGAQPEIYPQPALPPLISTRVSPSGVQAILAAARRAGLLGPPADYHGVLMPDSPDTVFTLRSDARIHTVRVTALGAPVPAGSNVSAQERRARQALAALANHLSDLRSWLPSGSVGPDHPYVPAAARVFVTDGAPQGTPHEPTIAWPLSTPLSTFGAPIPTPLQAGPTRCGVVQGGDLNKLLAKARVANQLTPWKSDARTFGLSFRPLLPDESGC